MEGLDGTKYRFDPRKVSVVPLDSVRPNTWNPKGKGSQDYEKVRRGIELKGLRLPIVVREIVDPERFLEVIDGEQRWTACKDLGYENIIVYNEGQVSDQEARELTLWYQTQVPFDEVQLAGLLAGMQVDFSDIEVPFTEQELDRYNQLANFSFENLDTEDPGDVSDRGKPEVLMIKVTEEQHGIIMMAIKQIQDENDNCSEGRALELCAADYLSGASPKSQ